MKRRFHAGGFHSLMAMAGRLQILRMLLLIPLIGFLCVRRAFAAVVLALTLVLDLAAGALSRGFDMMDRECAALESVADLCVQAALLMCLVPRFHALRLAGWLLLARLVLVLLPNWLAALRRGCAVETGLAEKALNWTGCALLIVPMLCPGMSAGSMRHLAWIEAALISVAVALGAIRNHRTLASGLY